MTDPVDKFLSDAVSAARDHADEGAHDGAHTRLRLRESLGHRGTQRRKRFTLIAAVIASMFGSTAFAYWAGWRPPWSEPSVIAESQDDGSTTRVSMRLPEARRGSAKAPSPDGVQTIVTMENTREEPALPDPGDVAEVGPTPAPPLAPPAAIEAMPPAPVRTVPDHRIAKPAPAEATRVPAEMTPVQAKVALETKSNEPSETVPSPVKPVESTPPPSSRLESVPVAEARTAQPSAEIAAYRRAHELHFRGGDAKAALAAWDAYLAKYPDGTLAPEARYDRALVLVRLSRWSEARAALAPFANAKVGSYRQKEAAAILAAIRDR